MYTLPEFHDQRNEPGLTTLSGQESFPVVPLMTEETARRTAKGCHRDYQ
jgi:hypothetical protein